MQAPGSQLVHALLAHDLVDELHLLLYPLTLGSGNVSRANLSSSIISGSGPACT
jgi:riboflavin biosynthesis pyrimidine reductase